MGHRHSTPGHWVCCLALTPEFLTSVSCDHMGAPYTATRQEPRLRAFTAASTAATVDLSLLLFECVCLGGGWGARVNKCVSDKVSFL